MSDLYLDRNGEVKRRNEGRMQLFIARPTEGAPPKTGADRDYAKGGWFQASDARTLIAAGMERKDQPDGGVVVELGKIRAYLKGGRLGLEPALRHTFKRFVLRKPFPRVSEFHNLGWLRAAGVPAPKPLVGCVWSLRGLPRHQFSATEYVEGARDLTELIKQGDETLDEALGAAGRAVAAMHLAGFAHANCFPRNVTVDETGAAWILDAWRGGPVKGTGTREARWAQADVADFTARVTELGGNPAAFLDGYAST